MRGGSPPATVIPAHMLAAFMFTHAQRMERPLIFTNGCFDLLHVGHVELLQHCAFHAFGGGTLIVAVNSDDSVRRLKGAGRPVIHEKDRARCVAAIRGVDHVLMFDGDTPAALIELLKPDVLVKGSDWAGKQVAGAEHCGKVLYYRRVTPASTSALIASILGA